MSLEFVVDHFKVRSESGKEYTLVEFQEHISKSDDNGSGTPKEGYRRFATSKGIPAFQIDSETFEIFGSGELVQKI
jgi:hypothetical protein